MNYKIAFLNEKLRNYTSGVSKKKCEKIKMQIHKFLAIILQSHKKYLPFSTLVIRGFFTKRQSVGAYEPD